MANTHERVNIVKLVGKKLFTPAAKEAIILSLAVPKGCEEQVGTKLAAALAQVEKGNDVELMKASLNPCLVGNMRLLTSKGYRTIRDLWGSRKLISGR